jgi:hypothetical protein
MFIGGVRLERDRDGPSLRLADPDHAAEMGVGVSVNRAFANANWIGVAGREMFFTGQLRDGDVLDRRRFDETVRQAASAGWLDGIRLASAHRRAAGDGVEAAVRYSIGTDFALTFGRTAYSARLPMPRSALGRVVDHLNELNERARRRGYTWNALTNNCSHVIHNALAAAGIWDRKAVRGAGIRDTLADAFSVARAVVRRRMSDFAFPANTFVRLYEAANERAIDDAKTAYADRDIRRTVVDGWLVTGPGGLVRRYPMHDPARNELFFAGRDPVLASVPLLWDKRRTFDRLTRRPDPEDVDLAANLSRFRDRLARASAARHRSGVSAPRFTAFEERYFEVIAAALARAEAATASLSSGASSTAAKSPTTAAATS